MSECVILFRNPGNGKVGYVGEGDGDDIMVYRDRDAAISATTKVPVLRAGWPYQIVEMDEL